MSSLFSGIKVLDLTKVFSGPFATRMLADYGAEVIKIETNTNYDDSRNYPPLKNNWSGYFEILNRNKKSISLDLKNEADLAKFYELVKEADVFVENLTPSTKTKLKVDYAILKQINPKLIYASLSGVGQETDRKYYDIIAQAESGLLSLSGTPQQPMKIGPSIVDAFSGMSLAFGISSALYSRQKNGDGQYLDVDMLSCAMNLLESNLIEYSVTQQNPTRSANTDNAISPFGIYKVGVEYLALAIGNEKLWSIFSDFLHRHLDFDDQFFSTNQLRLDHNDELTQLIEKCFSSFSADELRQTLADLAIPCSKVHEMSDVASLHQLFERKALLRQEHSKLGSVVIPGYSIRFYEQDDIPVTTAPSIGQDNEEYGV